MAFVWPPVPGVYPGDFDLPLVDHLHERRHSIHWPFSRGPNKQETIYPDIDLHDYGTGYAIDIELPGFADTRDVTVEWGSVRHWPDIKQGHRLLPGIKEAIKEVSRATKGMTLDTKE